MWVHRLSSYLHTLSQIHKHHWSDTLSVSFPEVCLWAALVFLPIRYLSTVSNFFCLYLKTLSRDTVTLTFWFLAQGPARSCRRQLGAENLPIAAGLQSTISCFRRNIFLTQQRKQTVHTTVGQKATDWETTVAELHIWSWQSSAHTNKQIKHTHQKHTNSTGLRTSEVIHAVWTGYLGALCS